MEEEPEKYPPKNASYWKRKAIRLQERILDLEREAADIALIAHMQGVEWERDRQRVARDA